MSTPERFRGRWMLGLTLALSLLGSAVVGWRSRGPDPKDREQRRLPALPPQAAQEDVEDDTTTLPAVPERTGPPPAQTDSGPPEGRRSAWEAGFREARSAGWEGSISGLVVSPAGPAAGVKVTIEWVAAFRPDPTEAARLRRGRGKPDRDGVWWSKTATTTDEQGCFSLDGIPGVQVRVKVGGRTVIGQPGGAVQVRLDES